MYPRSKGPARGAGRGFLSAALCVLAVLGSGCAQRGSPSGTGAREAPVPNPTRITEFGVLRVFGPPGKGLEYSLLEVSSETERDAVRYRHLLEYEDSIVTSSESLRTRRLEVRMESAGVHADYRAHHGAGRQVQVTIDGKKIRHLNQDTTFGGPHSRFMPEEMEEPRILEEDLIAPYQWAFEQLIAERGRAAAGASGALALDGVRFQAISTRRLSLVDYRIAVIGTEELTSSVTGLAVETVRLEVTSKVARATSGAPDLPEVAHRFWVLADGAILRMETPRQPADPQNYRLAYARSFEPEFGGAFTEEVRVAAADGGVRSGLLTIAGASHRVDGGGAPLERPVFLCLEERGPARASPPRRFIHRLRWGLAAHDAAAASLEVTPGAPGEVEAAAGLLSEVVARPGVMAAGVVLVSRGRAAEVALALLERGSFARWVAIDPELPAAGSGEDPLRGLAEGATRVTVIHRDGAASPALARLKAAGGVRVSEARIGGVDDNYWPADSGVGERNRPGAVSDRLLLLMLERELCSAP